MQRITLAPVPGVNGTSKAVKRPDDFASALEVAASKVASTTANADYLGRVERLRPKTDKMAGICIVFHLVGYCVGHLPFFVETMRSINDTTGNTAFVMFVFVPSTAIWAMGLAGGLLSYNKITKGCAEDKEHCCGGCGGCCLDYRGRPNMGCAQVLLLIALGLHALIAYIETFMASSVQSWVIIVLIIKNILCIAGEIVGLCGACALGRAYIDPPVQRGTPVPVAVVSAADAV